MEAGWTQGPMSPRAMMNRKSLVDGPVTRAINGVSTDGGESDVTPSTLTVVYNEEGGELCRVNQYAVKEELGKGSFGTVRRGVTDAGEVAIKCVSKRRMRREGAFARGKKKKNAGLANLRAELDIIKRMQHPNIVELIEVLEDPAEDTVFIILELLGKPVMDMSVRDTVHRLPESVARGYFVQLRSAVEYLHNNGVIHRDIKPSNLLLDASGMNVKLVDFGVSHAFQGDDDWLKGDSGTYAFMAPEALDSAAALFRGRPADVWAMGVTLYCLVFATLPFHHDNVPMLFGEIREKPVTFEADCSEGVRTVLRRILEKDPSKRISLSELAEDAWVCDTAPPASSPPATPRISTPQQSPHGSPLETMLSANGPYRLTTPKKYAACSRKSVTRAFYPWKLLRTTRPGDGWGSQIRRQMYHSAVPQAVRETFL
eukprot:m.202946 g.202946  ORF g.202946 m.202946 type:complete len:428 (+) comp21992_c0_seq1:103-1386(+)